MNTLQDMIDFQVSLQKIIYKGFEPNKMSYEEKVELSKLNVLCAHEELGEVMGEMKYKNYHMYTKEYNEENIKTEIIDCLKFILNLGIIWGMDAIEFNAVFDKKSIENITRLKEKQNAR